MIHKFNLFNKTKKKSYTKEEEDAIVDKACEIHQKHINSFRQIIRKMLNKSKFGKYYKIYDEPPYDLDSDNEISVELFSIDFWDYDKKLDEHLDCDFFVPFYELEKSIIDELTNYCKNNNIGFTKFEQDHDDPEFSSIRYTIPANKLESYIMEQSIFESVKII